MPFQHVLNQFFLLRKVYVKVMNKLLDKGFEFLSLEIRRVESLIKDGQVTTDQKTEMQRRLNILQAFLQSEGPAEPLKNAELWYNIVHCSK